MPQQALPLALRRVTRAHPDAHLWRLETEPLRGLGDAHERAAQIALHVDAESLERRDVEDLRRRVARGGGIRLLIANGCLRAAFPAHQSVDRPQERRERLARAGRRDHEGVAAGGDRVPRAELRRRGRAERPREPLPGRGGEAFERLDHRTYSTIGL
jgi:hypothetical protein